MNPEIADVVKRLFIAKDDGNDEEAARLVCILIVGVLSNLNNIDQSLQKIATRLDKEGLAP